MFVISKLSISELFVEIIRFEPTEDKAVSWLHKHIKENENSEHRYVHSRNLVQVYRVNEGYIYNNKDLVEIYHLSEYVHFVNGKEKEGEVTIKNYNKQA